jgi:hypothetical protein
MKEKNYMTNWVYDMERMHEKYGVDKWVIENVHDKEKMSKFLEFRIKFLKEELDETSKAFQDGNAEEIVDGLIDLCVVAIGTLDAFKVDAQTAWEEVYRANMEKQVGVKESRPNPLGLPDLIKPEGWQAPDHNNNHGLLTNAFL